MFQSTLTSFPSHIGRCFLCWMLVKMMVCSLSDSNYQIMRKYKKRFNGICEKNIVTNYFFINQNEIVRQFLFKMKTFISMIAFMKCSRKSPKTLIIDMVWTEYLHTYGHANVYYVIVLLWLKKISLIFSHWILEKTISNKISHFVLLAKPNNFSKFHQFATSWKKLHSGNGSFIQPLLQILSFSILL